MRVLAACSLGGAGHLRPLLPLLDAARDAGHETLVIGPAGLAGMVDEAGYAFRVGGEPPESVIGPIREQLPVVPPAEASVLGNRELFGRLATTAMLPAMEDALHTWEPDLVVRDPCEYASAVAAWPLGIPTAQVAIGLAEVERGSIEVAAPALEAHRAGLVDQLLGAPYVTRFPASVDPSPFSDTRRLGGYRGAPAAGTVPDWWSGSTAPLIYVSFGTVLGYMSVAAQVYATVLDAVASLDARILLTVGRQFDPSQLDDIPANVHVEPWVDQDQVLGQADLVVCHGGSGTTFGALAAGLPVVIVPVFADQFANGDAVAKVGAGIVVDTGVGGRGRRRPPGPSDAARIRDAVATVLAGEVYRVAAGRIATEMAAAPSVRFVLEELLGVT